MTSTDTSITRRPGAHRWRWAAPAAALWSLAYGGLGLHWGLGGAGFPFGEGDIPDARAESLLGGTTAASAGPVIAALGFAGAALALVLARANVRGRARFVLLVPAWAAAFGLLALVPDLRVMIAVGYAPLFLVGLPFGFPPVDYFAVALPWPVCNLLICMAGGVLWAAAAVAFQRRTGGACAGCGRTDAGGPSWTSPASAARWGRWAAWTAFVIPLFYSVIRWAWALHIPLAMPYEQVEELHRSGLVWAGVWLASFAAAGGVLTLGLTQRWGEVWPRWVPRLAGRPVPRALPVSAAGLVTCALLTSFGSMLSTIDWSRPADWLAGPMTYWPLWAVALGVATLGYHLRRRGRCRACDRL